MHKKYLKNFLFIKVARGLHLAGCTQNCHCRADKGLTCQTYQTAYSCYSSFGGYACQCATNYYWNTATLACGKKIKYKILLFRLFDKYNQ